MVFKHCDHAQAAAASLNDRLFLHQTVLKVEKTDVSAVVVALNASNSSNSTKSLSGSCNYNTSSLLNDQDLDEYCSRATRTLYIGNLDRDVKPSDLREKLAKKYGDIIEIEIKKDKKPPMSSHSSHSHSSSSSSKAPDGRGKVADSSSKLTSHAAATAGPAALVC